MQADGHSAAYLEEANADLRGQFHAIISLCFVPPNDVPDALALLEQCVDDELDGVVHHLDRYYVNGRRRGRGRQLPRYRVEQ